MGGRGLGMRVGGGRGCCEFSSRSLPLFISKKGDLLLVVLDS